MELNRKIESNISKNIPYNIQNDKQQQNVHINLGNKFCDVPLYHGSIGPDVIDISSLYNKIGVFAYDVGLTSTAFCKSSITYIDGEAGELLYRGHPIEDLVEKCDYIDICHLLLKNKLPEKSESENFIQSLKKFYTCYSEILDIVDRFFNTTHPMAILSGCFPLLTSFFDQHKIDQSNEEDFYDNVAYFSMSQIAILLAAIYRKTKNLPFVEPDTNLGYVDNFIKMMFSGVNDDLSFSGQIKRAIEILLILHADHEQNASTSTLRFVASTYSHPLTCISSAIAALWGNAHGGANEKVMKMLQNIGSVDNVDAFLKNVSNGNEKLMGFGHRVYKNFDPRAKIIKQTCHKILDMLQDNNHNELFEIAKVLENRALNDEYFIKRNLYPNVDFYSGIVLSALEIPQNMFTCIFALSRTIGWTSHLKEMMSEGSVKIARPRQLYMGSKRIN